MTAPDKKTILEKLNAGTSFEDSIFDDYRNDREIVKIAIEQRPSNFRYAGDEVKDDRNFILEILTSSLSIVDVLAHSSQRIRADKEVVLEAVKFNGLFLLVASPDLKDDFDVVLLAVQDHGYNLKYASERIRSNKKIVLEAIRYNQEFINHASDELKQEIGKDDPLKYLESYFEKEKLEGELSKKEQAIKSNLIKM